MNGYDRRDCAVGAVYRKNQPADMGYFSSRLVTQAWNSPARDDECSDSPARADPFEELGTPNEAIGRADFACTYLGSFHMISEKIVSPCHGWSR